MTRSRRARRASFSVLGGANGSIGPPPSAPIITSVSQTAGKAVGGSVVNIVGLNFVSGMTSTLGSVSSISPTTATITTFAHAAGAFAWNVTTSAGTSPSQTFTYLAAPTLTSLSPNNGPATLGNTGVLFNGTNFPAAGTGCPVTGSVGTGTLGTVTLSTSTQFSANFSAPGAGSDAIAVSVDGAAATVTATFTGNPPPIDLSASNVGSLGGTGEISGANFVSGCTASADINGTPTSLTIAFLSSVLLDYTLAAGSYTVGTWPLTVTNPDGQSSTQTIFTITNDLTPQTLFGANLRAQYIASNATVSAGLATAVPDATSYGNNISASGIGASAPTYNASSSVFSKGKPSITHDGSTQGLGVTAFSTSASNTMYFYAAVCLNSAAGADDASVYYHANELELGWNSLSEPTAFVNFGSPAISPINSVNFPTCLVAGFTSGSPGTATISQDNQATVTTSPTFSTIASGQALSIGVADRSGSLQFYSPIEWCEIGVIDRAPTSTEQSNLVAYLNLTYGVNAPPAFTSMTPVAALTANAPARIAGTGFQTGVTVTGGGGIGALTVLTVTTTYIDVEVPSTAAGSYDLIITNPDGLSTSESLALNVTATVSAWTIFGLICVGIFDLADCTVVGSSVSAIVDQSSMGNTPVQATSANQPGYNSGAGGVFGAQPYMTLNGSTQWLNVGSVYLDSATPAFWCLAIVKSTSSSGLQVLVWQGSAGELLCAFDSGAPETQFQGFGSNKATWGSTVSTAQNVVYGVAAGASPTLSVDVANGTAVTHSGTGTVAGGAGYHLTIGSRNNGNSFFWAGDLAAMIILNAPPTTGQLAAWESYAQTRWGVP